MARSYVDNKACLMWEIGYFMVLQVRLGAKIGDWHAKDFNAFRKRLIEPPDKGRRGHTFSHTERASVATIYLSDRMHWICDAYAKYMRIYNYKIPVSNGLLVDAYAKHMLSIYLGDTVAQPTLYKTLGVCLVYVQHMQHIYILYTIIT